MTTSSLLLEVFVSDSSFVGCRMKGTRWMVTCLVTPDRPDYSRSHLDGLPDGEKRVGLVSIVYRSSTSVVRIGKGLSFPSTVPLNTRYEVFQD